MNASRLLPAHRDPPIMLIILPITVACVARKIFLPRQSLFIEIIERVNF